MSTPTAPYYYKEKGSDVYHWETKCSLNNYPDSGWKKVWTKPSDREQCNQCKNK